MPSSIQNALAPNFVGECCHKVEGKNRLTVPAQWRFEDEVELFMITSALRSSITVMTRQEVERLKRKADELTAEERAEFLHMLGSNLAQVTLDKGGRITIPEVFFEQLGLPEARQVWLTGSTETFNIWSVPDYEAQKVQAIPRETALKRKLGI